MEKAIIIVRQDEDLRVTLCGKTIVVPYSMKNDVEKMLSIKDDEELTYDKMNFLKEKALMIKKQEKKRVYA